MPKVTYVQNDRSSRELIGNVGESVMMIARKNMVPGIIAECGGCATCATCHVYVDPAWMDRVGRAEQMEADMLECVVEPSEQSRLSCQIVMTEVLDGLIVRVPASQG